MKIEHCKYILYVHNSFFTRNFRKGYMTYSAAHRNLLKYKNEGYKGELHDNYKGLVLELY